MRKKGEQNRVEGRCREDGGKGKRERKGRELWRGEGSNVRDDGREEVSYIKGRKRRAKKKKERKEELEKRKFKVKVKTK